MTTKVNHDLAEEGSLWYRCETVHAMKEGFGGKRYPGGLSNRANRRDTFSSGPWITIGCYACVSHWHDQHLSEAERQGVNAFSAQNGFVRWYHLVNYGWIHESNLFGFFRRIDK